MKVKYDVYFSCAMTGQPQEMRDQNLAFSRALRVLCEELKLELFCPEEKDQQGGFPEGQIYLAEKEIIQGCRLMVLFLNGPSCGAGGEAVICDYEKIPIILVSRDFSAVSEFVLDNPQIKAQIIFASIEESIKALRQHIPALIRPPLATATIAL